MYVPGLQYEAGLVAFVHQQLGLPIASTAPLGKISDGFSDAMRRFAHDQHVPWVDFTKGQRKDDVMHEYLAGFTAEEGVLFIGRAQEKTGLFRTEKRRNADGAAHPWIVRSTGGVVRDLEHLGAQVHPGGEQLHLGTTSVSRGCDTRRSWSLTRMRTRRGHGRCSCRRATFTRMIRRCACSPCPMPIMPTTPRSGHRADPTTPCEPHPGAEASGWGSQWFRPRGPGRNSQT